MNRPEPSADRTHHRPHAPARKRRAARRRIGFRHGPHRPSRQAAFASYPLHAAYEEYGNRPEWHRGRPRKDKKKQNVPFSFANPPAGRVGAERSAAPEAKDAFDTRSLIALLAPYVADAERLGQTGFDACTCFIFHLLGISK
jgi:hypothetical protein